ncbi:MAG TPA: phage portal protein, partial [Alphaproteobacteria bacterium]|nr:phage portal protein [Alphaproteobacteria bacterium]
GDSYEYWSAQDTRRVPAFDVAHVYWLDRPGQVRGVPWYAPVVIDMRDFDDYQDAQLLRQKVAACFTAFVRSPPSDFSLSDSKTDDAGRPLGEKVEPGMIEILQPGEEVTFGTPPQLQGEAEFASVSLHRIAAGLDISYEALTSDYSKVNFSSARMGWLQYQRQIKGWRHTMLEPMLLSTVGQWLIETATVMGLASPDDKIGWTYPGRQMIDPAKETKALAEQVRDGFKPWQDAVRELGEDPEEVIRKYQEDNERFDAAGLIFDLDPRRQNSNGTPRGSSNGQNQN